MVCPRAAGCAQDDPRAPGSGRGSHERLCGDSEHDAADRPATEETATAGDDGRDTEPLLRLQFLQPEPAVARQERQNRSGYACCRLRPDAIPSASLPTFSCPTSRSSRISRSFKSWPSSRDQVYRELQLTPGRSAVQVYLFENKDRYEEFMHAVYPNLPPRRAFFIAQQRAIGGADDLLVYTRWGDASSRTCATS